MTREAGEPALDPAVQDGFESSVSIGDHGVARQSFGLRNLGVDIRVQHHERAQEGASLADDQDLLEERVARDGHLDIRRRDLLAVGEHQDVLDAPGDEEVTVLHAHLVAGLEPTLAVEDLRRRLRLVPVARHDAGRAHDQLVELADAVLKSGQRPADAFGDVVFERADADDGAGLGESVALHERDAERDEDPCDVRGQGCAAADRNPQPPAEACADLRSDQVIEQRGHQQTRVPARPTLAVLEAIPADAHRMFEQLALECGFAVEPFTQSGMNALEDPRDRDHDGRLDLQQILGQLRDRPGKGDAAAGHDRQDIAGGPLERMRERQKGQEAVFGSCRDELERCLGVPEDVAMAEHHAFGMPGGAGGIDDGRQGVGVVDPIDGAMIDRCQRLAEPLGRRARALG